MHLLMGCEDNKPRYVEVADGRMLLCGGACNFTVGGEMQNVERIAKIVTPI